MKKPKPRTKEYWDLIEDLAQENGIYLVKIKFNIHISTAYRWRQELISDII